ncbi:MAG: alkaline phosphatase D family protein [Nitrososphaeraceae archaeon]|nr:alkaline phosphatase D family protein [Nitrososphaeraceae archaeon]
MFRKLATIGLLMVRKIIGAFQKRDEFLKFLADRNVKNVVFITTDVHYPATVKIESAPADSSNTSDTKHNLTFYEFVNRPLALSLQYHTEQIRHQCFIKRQRFSTLVTIRLKENLIVRYIL